MNVFKNGQIYEHTGKSYTIVKRSASRALVQEGSYAKPQLRIITKDYSGNEEIEVDKGYRTIVARKGIY